MSLRSRSFDDASALVDGVDDLLRRPDPLTDPAAAAATGAAGSTPSTFEPAFYVAASDASTESKAVAHFQCSGVGKDEVEILLALNALPSSTPSGSSEIARGVVTLSEGTFGCDGRITVPEGAGLLGQGPGTILYDAGGNGDFEIVVETRAEVGLFALDDGV
jgi:hypothetical protein